jgi:hypothetical protein
MPFYLFKNPSNGEIKEIFFKMNDIKTYQENNIEWNRVYTVPQASIDANIDPYSSRAFIEKTRKAGTVGELIDMSKDMSDKRGGVKNDPIKKSHIKDWKKTRNLKNKPTYTP